MKDQSTKILTTANAEWVKDTVQDFIHTRTLPFRSRPGQQTRGGNKLQKGHNSPA